MSDREESEASEPLRTDRRTLLKGVALGGPAFSLESRFEATKALLEDELSAPSQESSTQQSRRAMSSAAPSQQNLLPARSTGSVSVREIAEHTPGQSGPPYKLSEVAEDRGLLTVSAPSFTRTDRPFAFRELITSQTIQTQNLLTNAETTTTDWENWVADHFSSGLTKFKPDSKQELVDSIIWNVREGKQVRAVGSGHSHSKVAVPDQNFIALSWYDNNGTSLEGLTEKLDPDWLNQSVVQQRARVEAGATIKYLNRKLLKDDGLALLNQGSFDGQTLAGAVNTSTHGTGARIGSLADTVLSVELVTVQESPAQPGKPLVRTYRIEPSDDKNSPSPDPPTNRRKFEDAVGTHGTTLIQDDDVFHSAVVGYGCMGVAYSYVIKARSRYFLHEDVQNVKWKDFNDRIDDLIAEGDETKHFEDATGARHFQFRVNLAQLDYWDLSDEDKRNPRCLLISHREPHRYTTKENYEVWPSNPSGWPGQRPPERKKKGTQQTFRKLLNKAKGKGLPPKRIPRFVPPGINTNFQSAANNEPFESDHGNQVLKPKTFQGYRAPSYVALRRLREGQLDPETEPKAPPPAISTEIAVPADQVVTAVEGVFDEVIESDYAYHVPLGVRFVARSKHSLSPEYQGDTDRNVPIAKVEVPYTVGAYKRVGVVSNVFPKSKISRQQMLQHAKNALGNIEDRLITMSNRGQLDFARPHMGKTNTLSRTQLQDFYEEFETWEALHQELDAFGTFDNKFTDRKGLSIK